MTSSLWQQQLLKLTFTSTHVRSNAESCMLKPLPLATLWSSRQRSATGVSGWGAPATAELPGNVCVRLCVFFFVCPAELLCIVTVFFLAALLLVGRDVFPLKCLFSEQERRNPACLPPHERAEVRAFFFLTKSKHGYFWIQRENKNTDSAMMKNKYQQLQKYK